MNLNLEELPLKKLLILLSIACTSLFAQDFPTSKTLEINTLQALEKLLPIYRTKAIEGFQSIIFDKDIIKSTQLLDILEARLDERISSPYSVEEVKVKDELTSIYVSWFHTNDEQKAKDIYFKISSTSRTYEYYCSVLYTKTSFHVAGCEIYLNDSRVDINGITIQDVYMEPILPLYSGFTLAVYIDEKLDPSITQGLAPKKEMSSRGLDLHL